MADDNAAFRPCNMNYQNPGNFRLWMGCDNYKGILAWQTYGKKLGPGLGPGLVHVTRLAVRH
jgi:hypothetical protein